jgi:MoaA/NifB/PqqE/SkfB family radical SAM enzyme
MTADLLAEFARFIPPPLRALKWRAHPLDGKLLLFERDSGLNLLLEGDETAQLWRIAPRTLLTAVTNACNLTCPFCYRDLESRSLWRYETLLDFCKEIDQWGVLEVALGGGEPMLFPRWQDFIGELHATTGLCINFTTNGMYLNEDFLRTIDGKYGSIRVSLYEDNHWQETVALLARCRARFGVNWLITPAELDGIEAKFGRLLALGVRDFLLLSYKGDDVSMHFTRDDYRRLAAFVNKAHRALGSAIQIKLDVCWGNMLPDVPRLFTEDDCGAGDEFLSITSDKRIKPCSFHHLTIPFETVGDLRVYWQQRRAARQAALTGGCARIPDRGLNAQGGLNDAYLPLAAVHRSSVSGPVGMRLIPTLPVRFVYFTVGARRASLLQTRRF